jgi:hypothetical protein
LSLDYELSPDITVRISETHAPNTSPQLGISLSENGNLFTIHWHGVAQYCLDDFGNCIIYPETRDYLDNEVLRQPLYGSAIATALMCRGYLVFHASSVEISNEAIVFIGEKGQGKSTITVAAIKQGANFLSDDVSALYKRGDQWRVVPGPASVKLWPDSAKSLQFGMGAKNINRLFNKKHITRDINHSTRSSIPIRAFVILDRNDRPPSQEPQMVRLEKKEALLALLQGNYHSRYIKFLSSKTKTNFFILTSELLKTVDVFRLSYASNLEAVNDVLDLARYCLKK